MILKFLYRRMLFILIAVASCVFFHATMPVSAAEDEGPVAQITKQVHRTLSEVSGGASSTQFTARDSYRAINGVNVTPDACAAQVFAGTHRLLTQFVQFDDFVASFGDVFKRNDCLRNDIWQLEDLLLEIRDAMMALAFQCTQDSLNRMTILERQYTALEWQIRLLRRFGAVPNSQFQAIGYFKTNYEQSAGFDPAVRAIIESVTYYNKKYLECPDDTLKTKLRKVVDRYQRVKAKIKALWEQDIGGLTTYSEKEKAARQKRVKQKAKEWMSNVNLLFFKLAPITQTADNKMLGVPGVWDQLGWAKDGIINLGTIIYTQFTPLLQTIADVQETFGGNVGQYQLVALLRSDAQRYDHDKSADDLKKFYIQAFTQSSLLIAQDLENKIILADQCIQASYSEKEEIIALCNAQGLKSLPTFEAALKYLLDKQCTSKTCNIPAKWK